MPVRDGGGSFCLNNPDDETPIREMFALGDGLLIITEKCTYRVQLADQIDPQRQNPSLPPNFQQRLFDHGTKSELLCGTLLQSKVMFRKEFQSIDVEKAMQLSFDALCDVVAMDDLLRSFRAAEKQAIDKAQNIKRTDASLTVPGLGNVRAECKSFFQKADHVAVSLMEIVRLFYPEMRGKNWRDFQALTKARYGADDNFAKLLAPGTKFLQLVRDTRDCLEHANLKGVTTRDFEPQPDGTLARPTIEIDFRKSHQERCDISFLMEELSKAALFYFQSIVVHMCSKNVRPFAGMPLTVAALPPEIRDAWCVQFAYGAYDQSGQFIPCG
jgi:hypothetical protein